MREAISFLPSHAGLETKLAYPRQPASSYCLPHVIHVSAPYPQSKVDGRSNGGTAHAFPEHPSTYVPRPHAETDYLVDTPEPRALLQRTFLGAHPLEMMHSPYVSPASEKVLRAFYGDAFADSVQDLTISRLNTVKRATLRNMASAPSTPVPCTPHGHGAPPPMERDRSPTSLERPVIASPRGLSLFSEFPRACVVLGDAERLEREVTKLVGAMERDGVRVKTVWVKDGAHDVLMMGWWDEDVRTKVYNDIEAWLKDI